MTTSQLIARLKQCLGGTYGGTSLALEKDEFVLYRWSDAPVMVDVLVKDQNLERLIMKFDKLPKNVRLGLPKNSKRSHISTRLP